MPKISRYRLYKQRFQLGADLFALRLKMVRLEWQDYQSGWSALLLAATILLVSLSLAGLSLLFALQSALPPHAAAWTFSVMCGLFILLGIILFFYIRNIRQRQKAFLEETLNGLSEDIALLRGEETVRERIERHEIDTE